MNYTRFFSRQARQPKGVFGRFFMSRVFDRGNAAINAFVKQSLAVQKDEQALEIGYGTGFLINELAGHLDKGCIHGLDFSGTMAAVARKRNRAHIRAGRVNLRQGDFDTADFVPDSFDCVFTVNTLYFWEDPDHTIGKIHNILKPGGRLVIGFVGEADMEKMKLDREVFTSYSPEAAVNLLSGVFRQADILDKKHENHTAYCAVGIK
ncbi:MAG: class I SAM-dependent methyltransferase [Desulfobacterales bacterium]|nr:class I SAM-dependent methyltransferase [Desulfobacterales bacterium]